MRRIARLTWKEVLPVVALLVAGCAPSISPLYRDFEDRSNAPVDAVASAAAVASPVVAPVPPASPEIVDRIGRALAVAGWSSEGTVVERIVATAPRRFRDWGLYSVEVELEVAPLAGPYVRVLIHPYRRWFTGGRRKVPYMKKGLAEDVMKELTVALRAEGLVAVGTAEQRDRAVGAR